jgi:GH25 family lysozyme M1 (1,4-beta-N-acetylmuramidase)
MPLNGIDVSAAGQGPNFNWPAYRGKIAFAGVKISEGLNYADPDAARNIAGCRSLGIPAIGYHFVHAAEAGLAQCAWFLSRAAAAGMRPGDLLALDTEQEGLDGLSPAQLWTTAAGMAAAVHDHYNGMWPLVYTDISLAGVAPASIGNCPLWLANPDGVQLPAIGPWKVISLEQTGQRGVDTDVFYGDLGQLAKLAIPERAPAPPAPPPAVVQARALIAQATDALAQLGKIIG